MDSFGTKNNLIISISVGRCKGTQKSTVTEAVRVEDHGVKGDACVGNRHRQVRFLAAELIDASREKGCRSCKFCPNAFVREKP